jgi:hypothetical protein
MTPANGTIAYWHWNNPIFIPNDIIEQRARLFVETDIKPLDALHLGFNQK